MWGENLWLKPFLCMIWKEKVARHAYFGCLLAAKQTCNPSISGDNLSRWSSNFKPISYLVNMFATFLIFYMCCTQFVFNAVDCFWMKKVNKRDDWTKFFKYNKRDMAFIWHSRLWLLKYVIIFMLWIAYNTRVLMQWDHRVLYSSAIFLNVKISVYCTLISSCRAATALVCD